MNFVEIAEQTIRGGCPGRAQCREVLNCADEELLLLLDAAYRVRRHYRGNRVRIQVVRNVKSGLCSEDCGYCSQSHVSKARIERYPLLSVEELVGAAWEAARLRARRFCMALSGRGPSDEEIDRLCKAVKAIKEATGLPVCCSVGILEEGQAERLKDAGVDRVNHNLNTSERFHPQVCTTHTYGDRIRTLGRCRAAGLELCSGGIVGQGETDDDIIDLLLALREWKVESLPVNFLVPVEGTPFEDRGKDLNPRRCLKVLCLARLLNGASEIRAAGGREYHLRSLQAMALYVADSIFVSGYLTTSGQSAEEALRMIADLGLEVEVEEVGREVSGGVGPGGRAGENPSGGKRNIGEEIVILRQRSLLRTLQALPGPGGKLEMGGRKVLNFSSNDYLDLAGDARVRAAAVEAVERAGCGAGASRLMSGNLTLHEELESDLARMVDGEAALVFGSGFLANLGVLTALAGPGDAIFLDRFNHASLIDGARLSGARWHRYRHKDMDHLETLLCGSREPGWRLIVSDSVFSMDGDVAPLKDLGEQAQRHGATLVVDEAHAIAVMGPSGGGVCRAVLGSRARPDVIVGTMSKALGSYGGFVVCSRAMREFLINRARSFIYSTGLPPACLGAARAAVAIVESEEGLGDRLLAKARRFAELLKAEGFAIGAVQSQIIPVHVGENERAVLFSEALWSLGVLARAVRPPTVPEGTARLRLSVTLAHSDEDLAAAARALGEAARRVGVL